MDPILAALAVSAGIHLPGVTGFLPDNPRVAMDAQPQLVTVSSQGIPAFLSTFIDPKIIQMLVTKMKGAEIAGVETKKGDWTTKTAMFPMIESTGFTSSYDDYSNNGRAGANVNFTERQSYHYQVITEWGERELAIMGLARIDWANQINTSSILTLNKFQNKTYFYGVKGLALYGILNDPNLFAPLAPLVVNGQTSWANKDAVGVYEDIRALFAQLVRQALSIVDVETPMTLVMSSILQMNLAKMNTFGNVSVEDLLKKNFPNLKIKTAPEYSTTGGEMMQMFADNIEGQQTMEVAFTEKLRTHPVILDLSSFKQKKSQGTWGGIIYRPILVASMIGM